MNKFEQIYMKMFQENPQIIDQDLKSAVLGSLLAASAVGEISDLNAANNQKQIQDITINQTLDYAKKLIIYFQKTIKDSNGNCVVYDDANPKNIWDYKHQTYEQYKKTCKGKPTIGYGQTNLNIIKKGFMTQKQAKQILSKRVKYVYNILVKELGNKFTKLSIGRKGSLISLYYNLGADLNRTPKLIKALKENNYQIAAKEFLDCNKVTINGQKNISKGLTKRRQIESYLFKKYI